MRALIVFSLFIVAVFLVGTLVAYPLKLLLDPMLDLAFRKYLTYGTLITGLIISGIYLKYYNLLSFNAFGYHNSSGNFIKTLLSGFMYGVLIMLTIELLLLVLGIHELDHNRSFSVYSLSLVLIKALIAGTLIALLEESIFRGAMFSGLNKQTGPVITVIFTSLIYAAVHFIRYRDLPPDTDISWLTGISMLPEAFRRFYEWSIGDYFMTLFIFGILLGLLRLKHNNIAACIGMHAGVVMLIKVASYVTNRTHKSEYEFLVSQYNSTFGWLSFSIILLIAVFYLINFRKPV